MTTLEAYERYPEIIARLERTRSRWRAVLTGQGLATFVVMAAGSLLLVTAVAGFVAVPGWIRAVMLYGTLLTWGVGLVRSAIWPLFRDATAEQVARRIERAMPGLDNRLINAVQLAHDTHVPSPVLVNQVIRETAETLEGQDVTRAIDRRALAWRSGVALGLVVLLAAYGLFWPHRFQNAVNRIWHYNAYVPFVGRVRLVNVQPGDCSVVVGESVTVRVTIDNPAGRMHDARLYARPEGAALEEPVLMAAEKSSTFSHTISDIRTPVTYRVKVGDTESPRYRVTVSAKPIISGIDLAYHYPAYTGLAPRLATGGNISAVRYSYVDMTVRVNKPVRDGALAIDGERERTLSVGGDGRTLTTRLIIDHNATYRVRVTDTDGYANEDATTYRITAVDDRKPSVVIRRPGRDVDLVPGGRLTLVVAATDDCGIQEVRLWMQPAGVGEPQLVRRWTDFDRAREVPLTFDWRFPASRHRRGDSVVYYAEAIDTRNVTYGAERLTPQSSRSGKYVVKFLDRAAAIQDRVTALDRIRERLREILLLQREARRRAGQMVGQPVGKALASAAAPVRESQVDIRGRSLQVAGECSADDADQGRIRMILVSLANNEMAQAIKSAGDIARAAEPARTKPAIDALTKAQDRIIAVLQRLLDILPAVKERVLAEREAGDGHDLPPDAAETLKDLLDKLKKFADEQKKVIDATEDLAKTPVDDFTEEDKRKLKALEALEDKWAKFMKEAHSDLSKLPPQDFGDSTLLKELIEIQSDVEMAKDALAKKAVELAVPLEQAGLENAKELTTHLEKWLPDTPDRDQWKMEEPLAGVDQPQAPMAQLPKELEDIVGDLMEQEEDLFEDVEDVTSQWADSLDKGAGWDAMDGPISNMSAQGVTGNRLPNTSEIGGRSGEGRSGKSGGEFVEETATGKGGRRTPTRLTPDAFQKGEIKDTSKEAAGGSTGGGKSSGAAPEGLEGPVPPQLSRQMERLAGRQAELRNKAERINLQFKVMNYGSSKLDEVIREMRGVERDLAEHRYASALRRKRILLKGLRTTKMYLAGEIAINRDRTVNLPNRLQSDIRDAMGGEVPAGYERLLSKYYEALARGAHEAEK